MFIGVVITLIVPIISVILYSEMRKYALSWAAIIAILAAVVLWGWFAVSRKRS